MPMHGDYEKEIAKGIQTEIQTKMFGSLSFLKSLDADNDWSFVIKVQTRTTLYLAFFLLLAMPHIAKVDAETPKKIDAASLRTGLVFDPAVAQTLRGRPHGGFRAMPLTIRRDTP